VQRRRRSTLVIVDPEPHRWMQRSSAGRGRRSTDRRCSTRSPRRTGRRLLSASSRSSSNGFRSPSRASRIGNQSAGWPAANLMQTAQGLTAAPLLLHARKWRRLDPGCSPSANYCQLNACNHRHIYPGEARSALITSPILSWMGLDGAARHWTPVHSRTRVKCKPPCPAVRL
jgi:hypothetical protein